MGAFNLIGPAMQGTRAIGGLKSLLFGGGPIAPISIGVGLAPYFNKAAQDNPTKSARMSILGSTGTNLAGSSAVRAPSRKTEGYTSYGTYKVGDIEYDMASGRPLYMPAGSVYPSNSAAPFVPAAAFRSKSKTTPAAVLDPYAAQNRAYQQERARVEAMVKANPDMQKQEIADARAKVRDQGMAIWQQKYGNTPMGQPGGAIGRVNPLMDHTFGYQTGMAPDQIAAMQETAAPVQVAPGEIPYQQGDLGTRATLETGYDPAQYGLSPNLVEEMKKRLLQQAGK